MAHPVPLLEPISPIISHSQVTVLCYVMAHTLNNVTQLQIISIPPWYHPRTIYPPVPSYQKTRPGKHPWFVGDFQFWSLLSNHSSAYILFTITTLHQCIFNPSAGQNRTPNKAVGGERTLKTISTGSVCRSHSDLENISQALSSANYKNPQLSPIAVSVLSVLQSVLSSASGLPFYLPTYQPPVSTRIQIRSDKFTWDSLLESPVTAGLPPVDFNWAEHAPNQATLRCQGATTTTTTTREQEEVQCRRERRKNCAKMSRGIYLIFTVLIASSCCISVATAINHGTGGGGTLPEENPSGLELFKLRSEFKDLILLPF